MSPFQDSICSAIRDHRFLRIRFDDDGVERTDLIEPYTLGFNQSKELILSGYHWASDPGPAYSKGSRNYPVEKVISVEIKEQKFGPPADELAPRDVSQFSQIICDLYVRDFLQPRV